MDTLDQARKNWAVTIEDKGGYCPCCDRWGKVYRHSISGLNAKALLWMCANTKGNDPWIHMPTKAPRDVMRSTFALLRWWGLIQRMYVEPEIGEDQETKHSGYWKVTDLGWQFARGRLQVPKYVYLYNDARQGMSDETTHIRDCFGKKFNYSELMGGTWGDDYE